MNTPVFDREQHILGYLDHADQLATYHDFTLVVVVSDQVISVNPEPVCSQLHKVRFEWAAIGVARSKSEASYARVLTTDAPADQLNRLDGFKWFAEVHGKPIEWPSHG
jgi:hypothetical protein